MKSVAGWKKIKKQKQKQKPCQDVHVRSLGPVNMTLFGKGVFAGIRKLGILRCGDNPGLSKYHHQCPYKREAGGYYMPGRGEGDVRMEEAETGCSRKPRNAYSPQTPEEASNRLSLEPPDGSWPCRHFGLGQ